MPLDLLVDPFTGQMPAIGDGTGRRRSRWVAGAIIVAVAIAGSVAAAGMSGRGPLRQLGAGDAQAPAPPSLDVAPGDCATWTRRDNRASVRVVPCAQDHLIEITAGVDVADLPERFPSATDWDAVVADRCRAPAEQAYGAPLDPEGRFVPGGLPPDRASWEQGDRRLWCGIESGATPAPGAPGAVLTGGPTRGQPQFWTYQPGECLKGDDPGTVPCTEPHDVEVVGETTLDDNRRAVPAVSDSDGWKDLVGSSCTKLARSYLGSSPKSPWQVSWLPIPAGSWSAGKRNVTCVVGKGSSEGWTTVDEPAKPAGR